MKQKTDREFLEELNAWFDFNLHRSPSQMSELHESLKEHLKSNPLDAFVGEKIAETIKKYQTIQKDEEIHDDEDNYGDIIHNREWWDREISINTLIGLRDDLSNFAT